MSKSSPIAGDVNWRLQELLQGDLTESAIECIRQYYLLITQFNRKINLISKHAVQDGDITQIYDCILGIKIILSASYSETIHDIGSGNGLPGIIMAIMAPERQFRLVDVDERKVEFLKTVVSRLKLKNALIIRGPLENQKNIQCAVSRAFSSMAHAVSIGDGAFLNQGSYFHFKGKNWENEIFEGLTLCKGQKFNWMFEKVQDYEYPPLIPLRTITVARKCPSRPIQ
ncbi:MAG: 16S rRNA (guanine(527)-N(7))-methyltransferase RsmG [Bdellovibrionales bacterium]|nr:16S rRNA (guanine(527)-N(7))-methyltransferase RsmG [Bdellovibrionales bacterium]